MSKKPKPKPLIERSSEEIKGWFSDWQTRLLQCNSDKAEMSTRHSSEKSAIGARKKELYKEAKDGGYPKKVLDECLRRIEVGEETSFIVNRVLGASGYEQLCLGFGDHTPPARLQQPDPSDGYEDCCPAEEEPLIDRLRRSIVSKVLAGHGQSVVFELTAKEFTDATPDAIEMTWRALLEEKTIAKKGRGWQVQQAQEEAGVA